MSEKRKIQRFNLDEGRIWEAIEGLSPFKTTYTLEEVCEKLNELAEENEQLKKAEKINMEYAEQILEENKKLRIVKNDLRIENEQLKKRNKFLEEFDGQAKTVANLKAENEQLKSLINKKRFKLEQWTDHSLYFYDDLEQSALHMGIAYICEKVEKKLNELSEENEQLKQKLENLDLNEKNDTIKMIDGKFFIRM